MITELWEATPVNDFSSDVLVFSFTALSGGQTPALVTHSAGTFTESVTKGLDLQLSFIVKFTSNSAQGIDGEFKMELTTKANMFFTPSHGFIIANRQGEYDKTAHVLGFLQAAASGTFQVTISEVFGGGLLQMDISEVRLFISDQEAA